MQAPILTLSTDTIWGHFAQQYSPRNSRAAWHAACIMTRVHPHTHINTDVINTLYWTQKTKLLRGHSRLHVQQRLASDCVGGKQIGAFKVL